jgi:hypothetical protein
MHDLQSMANRKREYGAAYPIPCPQLTNRTRQTDTQTSPYFEGCPLLVLDPYQSALRAAFRSAMICGYFQVT